MPITLPKGIEVDEQGIAFLAGTGFPVEQIAEIKTRTNLSAQEIQTRLPYLTLEQVEAAFAYYETRPIEINSRLQKRDQEVQQALDALLEKHKRQNPTGQNWLQRIVGTWPGDETDEEIDVALERLS